MAFRDIAFKPACGMDISLLGKTDIFGRRRVDAGHSGQLSFTINDLLLGSANLHARISR